MKRVNEKQMEEMQREKKQKQPTVEPMEKSLDFWISKPIKYIFNFCCLKEEGSGEFLQMMRCVHVCGFPPCYAHVQTHLELECLFLSLFYGVLDTYVTWDYSSVYYCKTKHNQRVVTTAGALVNITVQLVWQSGREWEHLFLQGRTNSHNFFLFLETASLRDTSQRGRKDYCQLLIHVDFSFLLG